MNDRRDRGAADALGLVLIAPVAVGLAILVVSLGRNVDSQAQVRSAAEAAAQAAALERTPPAAAAAAERVAAAMLTDSLTCDRPDVVVDTSRFAPGGSIVVDVTCVASSLGVAAVQREGVVHRARAVAHIDRFRTATP